MKTILITTGELMVYKSDYKTIFTQNKNALGVDIRDYIIKHNQDNQIFSILFAIKNNDDYYDYLSFIEEHISEYNCVIDAFNSNLSDDINLIKKTNPECKIISVKETKHNDITINGNTLIDSVGNKIYCDDLYKEILNLINNNLKLKW